MAINPYPMVGIHPWFNFSLSLHYHPFEIHRFSKSFAEPNIVGFASFPLAILLCFNALAISVTREHTVCLDTAYLLKTL